MIKEDRIKRTITEEEKKKARKNHLRVIPFLFIVGFIFVMTHAVFYTPFAMKLVAKIITGLVLGYMIYKTIQLEREIRNCSIEEVVGLVTDKFSVDKGRGSTFEFRNSARDEIINQCYLKVDKESYNVSSETYEQFEVGDRIRLTLLPISQVILQIEGIANE